MFGMKLQAKIGPITADVKEDDGTILRRDTAVLHFEFTKEFAGGLNKRAAAYQQDLRDMAVNSVAMPLDVGAFLIKFHEGVGDGVDLEVTAESGKLSLKAPNKEDANPQAKLTIVIPTEDESHMWFVHHQRENVDVTMVRRQESLPGVA